jgi:hypothetical protein
MGSCRIRTRFRGRKDSSEVQFLDVNEVDSSEDQDILVVCGCAMQTSKTGRGYDSRYEYGSEPCERGTSSSGE